MSSTSTLSTKLATKQQFWEDTTCRQRFCFVDIHVIMYYFEKERIHLKKRNIDKISHQKGLTVCEKHTVKRVQDTQPTTVYLANPNDPSCNLKLGFWSDTSLHLFPDHCFVDNYCRRRDEIWPDVSTKNLSSMTALSKSAAFSLQTSENKLKPPWNQFNRYIKVQQRMTTGRSYVHKHMVNFLRVSRKCCWFHPRRFTNDVQSICDSALLVLNGTSLNSDSTLLALNWWFHPVFVILNHNHCACGMWF